MLKKSITILLVLLGLFPSTASAAQTSDVNLGMDINASYHVQDNFLERNRLGRLSDIHFTKNRAYGFINLHPSLSVQVNEWVYGNVGVNVSWENPVDEGQEDEVESDVTSAYLSFKGSHIRTDIGIQPIEFANGFILADNVLAAVIQGDIGKGYAKLEAACVLDSSPMVGLTLGYRPGYFERLEIFGVWLSDRDDTLAYSLPYAYQELLDLSSEGNLYYFGGAADLFVGDALLTFVGAYQSGQYTVGYLSNGRFEVDVNAYFGDISLEKNLSDSCTVGFFCYLASGDDTPFRSDIETFIAATPYNPRATIFFDPDFMDNDDADRLTFSSGFFGGAIAPGISLTLLSEWGLTAEAALIYLYAHRSLDDGSQWYGWEADLAVSYAFGKKYRLFVEAARFEHGDYFESLLDEKIDPAVRFVAGIDASF
jgi:hypothetical protein